jgi:hypothetical protein
VPGHVGIYKADRNFLLLERRAGAWRAMWEMERRGCSDWLAL